MSEVPLYTRQGGSVSYERGTLVHATGGGVSYERGTPVHATGRGCHSEKGDSIAYPNIA